MANYRGFTWLLLICLVNESIGDDNVSKRGFESALSIAFDVMKGIFTGFRTSCTIIINNESKHTLKNFKGVVIEGTLGKPVESIQPQDTLTIIPLSKTVKFLMGNEGIMSWQIGDTNTRLVVMWRLKAIKRKEKDRNTLWIALTPSESFNVDEWKKYVVSDAEVTNVSNFKKGIFTQKMNMETLQSEFNEFKATGLMGTGKNPTATIDLSEKYHGTQGKDSKILSGT